MQENDTVHVMQEDWDYLIILDACRFDTFEIACPKFLPNGNLTCVKSVGSSTNEWRNNSFRDYYEDVVYISSNPYVNSQGPVQGFSGNDHFGKIIDVWATGWDQDAGTVRPKTITHEALRAIQNNSNKRFIIHYLQPHAPYLGFASDCLGFISPDIPNENVLNNNMKDNDNSHSIRNSLSKKLVAIFRKFKRTRYNPHWYAAQILRLPPISPMDAVRRKYGKSGLAKAYQENLNIVLEEVSTLIRYLKGKIVITADHGELLGENGIYSHDPSWNFPQLYDVPWFTLEKAQSDDIPTDNNQNDQEKAPGTSSLIEERLKSLGYL